MTPGTTDGTPCPVCGTAYDRRVVVARGDRWDDLYPGSPFSFFERYRRRCTAREDVESERDLDSDERAVYFHGGGGAPDLF